MKGFFNHEKVLKGKVVEVEAGYILGTLYHLKQKGYPGFVKSGNGKVFGEILTITDYEETLRKMDALEGFYGDFSCENEYNRMPLKIFEAGTKKELQLDVYVYNQMAFNNHFDERILVENGCWKTYMTEQVENASY